MIPKPLTKEERDELDRLRVTMRGEGGIIGRMQHALEQACAAEAFWREAVKNAEEIPSDVCAFCSRKYTEVYCRDGHAPDCAWKLAQDGE